MLILCIGNVSSQALEQRYHDGEISKEQLDKLRNLDRLDNAEKIAKFGEDEGPAIKGRLLFLEGKETGGLLGKAELKIVMCEPSRVCRQEVEGDAHAVKVEHAAFLQLERGVTSCYTPLQCYSSRFVCFRRCLVVLDLTS